MEPISLTEYRQIETLQVPYIVHRLVPRQCRLAIFGPNKAGKSQFALQLMLAMAQGRPFLGRHTEKVRILYLQFDTPDPIWKIRLDDLAQAGVDLSGDIMFVRPDTAIRPFDIMTNDHRKELEELIEKAKPDVVFIDVLSKIHRLDENDQHQMKMLMDRLNILFDGMALILIHHTNKPKPDSPMPRPSNAGRGSGFIGGETDANWLLWPEGQDENILVFTTESRFDEPLKQTAIRDPETNLFNFPEEKELMDEAEKLVALCDEFPGKSHNQLADIAKQRFHLSRATYHRRMTGLKCRHSPRLIVASEQVVDTQSSQHIPLPPTSSLSQETLNPHTI